MRLTQYTDYSLRVLIYLAARSAERSTIEEMSRAYGISRAHLMKVVHELGQQGFVDTTRGRGGGVRLARRPDQISVGDVVRAMEDRMDLVECFGPEGGACRIEPSCALRGALESALNAFLSVLEDYTLADLVARRRKGLLQLLDSA